MTYQFSESECRNFDLATSKEWLLTNGIGGFAMGTVAGVNTRRYHGLLIAALDPPTERTLIFSACDAFAVIGKTRVPLSSNQYPGAVYPNGIEVLSNVQVGKSISWNYSSHGIAVQKILTVEPGKNAIKLEFINHGKKPIQIQAQPLICFRDFHSNFTERPGFPSRIEYEIDQTVIGEGSHAMAIFHPTAIRRPVHGWFYRFVHQREIERGLDPRDDLYCPCELEFQIGPGESCFMVASMEIAHDVETPVPSVKRATVVEQLEDSVEKFVVCTENRSSIMAGFPWFSDWGRDTMISLQGICLDQDRIEIAKQILRDYASQMEHGLIPNRFVEHGEKADYNTVDATLWFAHCVYLTLEKEWDEDFAIAMYDKIAESIRYHRHGTLFGIAVDPVDGLLTQGESGSQLTWMDAKIGDWVITPRHGKPVEINGLWINMLRVAEWMAKKLNGDSVQYTTIIKLASKNFEEKFWHEGVKYYMDTVEPNDASLRPNQVIAMSLPFSPCDPKHAKEALIAIERELLTPVGLRTLSPDDPNYHPKFKGHVSYLDEAYHQGTVWPWLFGPYIRSYIKYGGSIATAKTKLDRVSTMLTECGIGGISECYDGDAPHMPGGCPWQAWSAAEILSVMKNELGM